MAARSARLLAAMSITSLACVLSFAAETIAELQARFDHDPNSVHKAKLFEKLGDAEIVEIRQASKDGDFSRMDLTMEKYRDNARLAEEALKRQHPDAERQADGYKRLQMHIHRMLREIDETLLVAPSEYQPPLELVRHDLSDMDGELLRLLFPTRPGPKPRAPARSSPPEVSP